MLNCNALLCSKLLNSCMPDTIDERALNLPPYAGSELLPKEALQNSNLCTHAATALGCNVSAISAQDILDGKVRLRCTVLSAEVAMPLCTACRL